MKKATITLTEQQAKAVFYCLGYPLVRPDSDTARRYKAVMAKLQDAFEWCGKADK